MTADQILAEIREANLSYLMLAQSLIRADREQALYRLGISEETADADRRADAGADDEDRRRQHAAVPLPHGRRHGLGPAHQPRQGAPPTTASTACTPRILMAGRHQEAA